ncbi:MAG: hypothetical protein Tsb009_34060 [Planctomycetaceae bacterium]
MTDSSQTGNSFQWDLAAESITVRVRWIGLGVGYVLVNLTTAQPHQHAAILNAILTIGAVYAVIDSYWSYRGKVFLSQTPLIISLMESVFIGLLCYFDVGPESPFRFYYFLSLIVCAIRYSPTITYSTFALHALSFTILAVTHHIGGDQYINRQEINRLVLYLILMGWVTWAGTALASLMKRAERQLSNLNDELKKNQTLLEERIDKRTRELQQSQALLVQQEKQAAFGLLAAGIAHEVGNPLAAISSLVQMLNRKHTDDYTRERLQMVDDQLLRIQRTLRELVDFSRPANSEPTLCNIHETIDAALNIAKYYKRRKGKKILTRYQENLPRPRVVRDQLVQVFLNLILNAMDATSEGGVIEISTAWKNGRIDIAVTDDGHGIPEENRDAIFQPYVTTKPTGTGLGLFVCKNLIEKMGSGRIELAKTSPKGTTFVVSLPCENVSSQELPAEPPVYSTEEVQAT